jgi:hypothetical protein
MRFQVDMWRLPGSEVGLSFLPLLSEGCVSSVPPPPLGLVPKGGKCTRGASVTRFDLAAGKVIWVVGSVSVSAATVGKVIIESVNTTVINVDWSKGHGQKRVIGWIGKAKYAQPMMARAILDAYGQPLSYAAISVGFLWIGF